ncbi:MAG: radical SAM protein, partial [Planctomycetota bacterium]
MEKITRRQFLYCSAAFLSTSLPAQAFFTAKKNVWSGAVDLRGKVFKGDAPQTLWKWSREGHRYNKLSNSKVVCGICPNRCILAEGDRSVCRSKVNVDGKLYSLTYGNPCAVNFDPIEKKPLFHFKPKSKAFSIATAGCNFRCLNCQNYEISQAKPQEVRTIELYPQDVVSEAQRAG